MVIQKDAFIFYRRKTDIEVCEFSSNGAMKIQIVNDFLILNDSNVNILAKYQNMTKPSLKTTNGFNERPCQ